MNIFHAYDIRGIYPEQINESFCYELARRTPTFLKSTKIMVAQDARLSSPSLHKEVVRGLREAGCDVVDVGIISTPHSYFAEKMLNLSGAIMITASHNPKEYNGIKVLGPNGQVIGLEQGLSKLRDMMKEDAPAKATELGSYEMAETHDDYVDFCVGGQAFPEVKVVVDQSHASATAETDAIKKLCDVVEVMNGVPDGNFPVHGPDPLDTHVHEMIAKRILAHSADFGVIFDGDCDRVTFIDEKGQLVENDHLFGIMTESLEVGDSVVYEVRTSRAVINKIKENGLKGHLWKVGRTNIITKCQEVGAKIGGETSGHFMFEEADAKECVPLAVRKVLEVMKKSGRTLSELADEFRIYYATPPNTNTRFTGTVEEILKRVEDSFDEAEIESVNRLDKLSVYFKDGAWFNLRPSNTEPVLRLKVEAKTAKRRDELLEKLEMLITGK